MRFESGQDPVISAEHQSSIKTESGERTESPKPLKHGDPDWTGYFTFSHSKTECRGFKSFCPCQSNQAKHL